KTSDSSSDAKPTMVNGLPHFDTPEAAMRYLTDAWNRKDADALRHVTNPGARDELDAMHAEAVNLRLDECYPRPGHGDYECTFIHKTTASRVEGLEIRGVKTDVVDATTAEHRHLTISFRVAFDLEQVDLDAIPDAHERERSARHLVDLAVDLGIEHAAVEVDEPL